ncbi:hypothetical protein [Acuticoccus sp.]|uniref:hypothetical protein n=1 Tax=Acuticoccus sp. TaxID=1904378 RepID=UPI003B51FBAD
MIVLGRIAGALGWHGMVGLAVGAVLVAAPAYHAGKWTEHAAWEERLERVLAERHAQLMEKENERIDRALRARRAADREPDGVLGDGGVPDDGFRRD